VALSERARRTACVGRNSLAGPPGAVRAQAVARQEQVEHQTPKPQALGAWGFGTGRGLREAT
jgi:hypothetical protein